MNDSESCMSFATALVDFTASLKKSGLAIYSVGYNMEAFGSWTIGLGTRHRRLLVHWDGKDAVLSVSRSLKVDSRATEEWTLATAEQLENGIENAELFSITENLVLGEISGD